MKRKTLFTFLSFVIVFIFFLNFVAGKLYWYSSIWWFDILMHFLGGFWLGLLFLWVFYRDLNNITLKKENFLKIILGVFIVGFGWEIYEIVVNDIFAKNAFDLVDTTSDLVCDLTGSIASYYLFKNISKKD